MTEPTLEEQYTFAKLSGTLKEKLVPEAVQHMLVRAATFSGSILDIANTPHHIQMMLLNDYRGVRTRDETFEEWKTRQATKSEEDGNE